jgi:hypothetical protein
MMVVASDLGFFIATTIGEKMMLGVNGDEGRRHR